MSQIPINNPKNYQRLFTSGGKRFPISSCFQWIIQGDIALEISTADVGRIWQIKLKLFAWLRRKMCVFAIWVK